MDELCTLMKQSMTHIDVDRLYEAILLGRRINQHIEHFSEISIDEHIFIIHNIYEQFKFYNICCEDDDMLYENKRTKNRCIFIKECIKSFLNTYNITTNMNIYTIRYLLMISRSVFIHIYFLGNESDTNTNPNIHDYERPVTFYEYDVLHFHT